MARYFEVETPEECHEEFLYSLHREGVINDFELEAERQMSGLSTMHIRRKHYLSEKERAKQLTNELMNRTGYQKQRGKIEIYPAGNLVKCEVPQVKPNGRKVGDRRSRISGFSRQSRLRMMRKVSKLEKAKRPLFFTLTYPDEFSNTLDGKEIKEKHLKNFWKRMIYKYPEISCIWKLEYQTRKSGENIGELYPHFHLLVWGLYDVDLEEIREYVAEAWWGVCGELSDDHLEVGTRVERLRSYRGIMSYISKYMGKEVGSNLKVGRWWGVKGRKYLPQAKKIVVDFLRKEQYERVIAFMAYYARLPEGDWKSLEIFIDGRAFLKELDKIILGTGV
jgi:hypothetical protein